MYREFSFTSVQTDARNKSIVVFMTAEIDAHTVNGDNLQLLDCSTNSFVIIDYLVENDKIIITLPRYPAPNSKYTLSLHGITDIVGNKLNKGINYYDIVFESSVKTEVKFVSPAYSEEVDKLIFSLYEYIDDRDKVNSDQIELLNSFYIEVALDNLFNNIVFTTELLDKNTINIMDIPNGQYYARARVQKDDSYGNWSEVLTFVLNSSSSSRDSIDGIDDDSPVFYKPLAIIGVPKDGDDINSFFIEFSDEVDPDSLSTIEVFRRII